MLALRFHEFGLDQLRLEELPRPSRQDQEVLIRVLASSINPSDIKNVQGMMSDVTSLPRIPGHDFAGIVEDGPTDLINVPVWGTGGDLGFSRDGTHAEYIALPASALVRKPDLLSAEQAAASALGVATAWAGLFDRAHLKKGETLLVTGANGSVGSAVVQLGCWAGARVIGVDRSSRPSPAEVMLNSASPAFPDEFKRAVDGGVDVAFDTVSGPMFGMALASLRTGGRMVEITVQGDPEVRFNLLEFYRKDLRLFGLNTLRLDATASSVILENVGRLYETNWLKPREFDTYPLSEAVRAYQEAARGGKKAVLVMR